MTASGQSATRAQPAARDQRAAGPALGRRAGRDGTPRPRRTLHADTGTWTNNPTRFNYQWLRCDGTDCQAIPAPRCRAYLLTKADKGHAWPSLVTAANAWVRTRDVHADAPIARAAGQHARPGDREPEPADPAGRDADRRRARLGRSTPDTTYSLSWERCNGGVCRRSAAPPAPSTRCSPRTSAPTSSPSAPPPTSTAPSPRAPPRPRGDAVAGPRWKTLPLISNSTGASATR